MNSRVINLDYLRGLSAFGIMIYHYNTWLTGQHDIESFLARVGVYGVALFYVLSGLTLFHVYEDRMKFNIENCLKFGVKRFFRIFPLLWIATIATIFLTRQSLEFSKLFLNLTGLFGLVDWSSYYANGAWSIGNELFFYLLFPFFIFFRSLSRILLWICFLLILSTYLVFAFRILDKTISLGIQWNDYVNPLNQAFLFMGGFMIGHLFKWKNIKWYISVICIVIGVSFFVYYPVSGESIVIVTELPRILFTCSCFLVCFGSYKVNWNLPAQLHRPLSFLGEASYSIYMLHGLVFIVVKQVLNYIGQGNTITIIIVSLVFTLFTSYISYNYFEKYFMKLGARYLSQPRFQSV